jgi:hypothetical protein
MSNWSIVEPSALSTAMGCCKGSYQRDIIMGWEAISGSTLKGKARRYGYHYHISRMHLFTRLKGRGLVVTEKKGSHNSRILVVYKMNSESFD